MGALALWGHSSCTRGPCCAPVAPASLVRGSTYRPSWPIRDVWPFSLGHGVAERCASASTSPTRSAPSSWRSWQGSTSPPRVGRSQTPTGALSPDRGSSSCSPTLSRRTAGTGSLRRTTDRPGSRSQLPVGPPPSRARLFQVVSTTPSGLRSSGGTPDAIQALEPSASHSSCSASSIRRRFCPSHPLLRQPPAAPRWCGRRWESSRSRGSQRAS